MAASAEVLAGSHDPPINVIQALPQTRTISNTATRRLSSPRMESVTDADHQTGIPILFGPARVEFGSR